VTQRPEAQGLLWPSKLGLLLTLPRAIVWVGVEDGAIARELAAFSHARVFPPGDGMALAQWLIGLKRQPLPAIQPPSDPAGTRSASLARWSELLAGTIPAK
jgi:hypothetical protein